MCVCEERRMTGGRLTDGHTWLTICMNGSAGILYMYILVF